MANYSPVKDRQDIPIWNAIEANNFKQALKLVDKRLAKKPTDYLQALKTYIKAQSPSISERAQVLISLEALPTRKPPVTDLEAIDLYDEALGSVVPDQQESWQNIIGEIRCQSVKSAPKDETLSKNCLKACLSKGDLDHARQIAISLEKNFPDNHGYVFWNITMTFLYSNSPNCPEMQRSIFGKLALAQIGKLANATIEAGASSKLPTRSIHMPQELHLLQIITAKYGTLEKQLEYLQDPFLGPESVMAKGDWSLLRDKLQLMAQARQWQDLFEVTGKLLKRARTKDASGQISESRYSDWLVWDIYLKSAHEISLNDSNAQVAAEIQAHLDPHSGVDKSWRRNAALAWLRLSFEDSSSFESGMGPGKMQPLLAYLEKYGQAITAYNDIRPFAERLASEDRIQLVRNLTGDSLFGDSEKLSGGKLQFSGKLRPLHEDFTTAETITALINKYKLIYLATSSLPEQERLHIPQYKPCVNNFHCTGCYQPCGAYCRTCLEIVARSALQSYWKAVNDDDTIMKTLLPTDRHPADDLCVLSAMCLIKLSFIEEDSIESIDDTGTSYILQATVLLEHAWSHSKSNFQISLLLVRLYSILGAGSLAMRAFQRLGVKQIQLDTLSYTLFDRISSLHPHPFTNDIHGSSQFPSPVEHLEKQQRLYKKTRDHVSKNRWISLEHGSYNSIFQIEEFDEKINNSMSAVMSVVEQRKIVRLIQPGVPLSASSIGHDIFALKECQPNFSDTNDYESAPSFEASQEEPFGKLLLLGLGPSILRTHMNLVAENLMLIIDPVSDASSVANQLWLRHRLENGPDEKSGHEKSRLSPSGLTKSEHISMQAHASMANIILCVGGQERESEYDSASAVKAFNEDLYETLEKELTHISSIKTEALATKNTLHSLYTAYELGTTVLKFISYLSRTKQDVYNTKDEANIKTRETAERLLHAVIEKSTGIKRGLDESGWIDKVLESASRGEQAGTNQPKSVADTLKEMINENFLEEWAGHVLESWRDSVVGFSYFKVPKA